MSMASMREFSRGPHENNSFLQQQGGVGKTSLVYHLAYMFAAKGVRTLAVDLDPQANLTAMFLPEHQLEFLWPEGDHPQTIYGTIQPILKGVGDIVPSWIGAVADNLGLIPGDLFLSRFEDKLSDAWPRCHNRDESAFRVMTAFFRIVQRAMVDNDFHLALVDVGPMASCDRVQLL